jgi:hypothetical protein
VVIGLALWGAAAIWFCAPGPAAVRGLLAAGYAAGLLLAFVLPRTARRRWLGVTVLFAAVLGWWLHIPPSNDRDWLPDVAVLPDAVVDGDRVTVHNIRHCDYRSETDFDVRHYDATYDLTQLQSVDLFICRWGSPFIAHTMMSFGFADGRYLCFSIETRKEQGEGYDPVRGAFRQYELTYVVADERDVVRVRTNFRGEDLYCYRLQASASLRRSVLLDYLRCINNLRARPEWYNALTSNCTTNIRGHTRPYASGDRCDWRLLVNGYLEQMLYDRGAVSRRLDFAALRAASRITDRARQAGDAADFSQQIRRGLPEPETE